jgi:Brp/Blh family beta-carotene 15,15'-monooxygenase
LRIFSILADASGAAWVLDTVLDYLVPLHLLAFIVTVCVCIARLHTQRSWFALTEMLSCALLFVFASPLTSFGVYFIAVHSVRHLLRVWLKSAASQQLAVADIAIAGVKYTWPVVAIAIAYVTYFSLPVNFISVASLNSAFTESVLRAVFIGLSALTTPHAFLVWQKFT